MLANCTSSTLGNSTIGKLSVTCSLRHLRHSRRLSTSIFWFTHVVADEATQGIDPAAQEQCLENSFDSCVAGKNPDHPDSIYGAGFDGKTLGGIFGW